MTLSGFFWMLADIIEWTFQIFEIIGGMFNVAVICVGFIGLFFWLNTQRKFNEDAARNPEKLK